VSVEAKGLRAVRIGIMSFSDGRQRVHDALAEGILREQGALERLVTSLGVTPIVASGIAHSPRTAVSLAKELAAQDVAAVVYNMSVFAFPNFASLAAVVLNKPTAILSPAKSELPGMGGMLAAAGGLRQIGVYEERIWGSYESDQTRRSLDTFMRAAGCRHALRGQVYGQIGGRSMGMLTGVSSSPAEWLRVFGVDIDHADQSEILRLAQEVSPTERERGVKWIDSSVRKVHYQEGSKLTRETLGFQVACAMAVKRLAREREFDFVGIKCHYDLSEYYCTQCLSASLLPFDLDWDGLREPMVCACEADADGALSMQILKLLSGLPPLFCDLRHFDEKAGLWTLCNCGGQSVYYSRRSSDPTENLAAVELVPVIPKYGGTGAHVRYVGCAGPLTFARLTHDTQAPELLVFKGEAVEAEEGKLAESCPQWPQLFVKTHFGPQELLGSLHANHVHAVAGDWVEPVKRFAAMVGVRCRVLQ
jgi:L-fucose/D-arabinose isomerase